MPDIVLPSVTVTVPDRLAKGLAFMAAQAGTDAVSLLLANLQPSAIALLEGFAAQEAAAARETPAETSEVKFIVNEGDANGQGSAADVRT